MAEDGEMLQPVHATKRTADINREEEREIHKYLPFIVLLRGQPPETFVGAER